ncbi:membrane protein of unknown function [Methylacidimicrobium sp. AP8]|uniref:hypothetical protein n=1 Tax=Methylacidimicrobium sp. AP8 TaxID=2730359 RepID=UPI0018C0EFCD|nr:hypothetical protein [Methylacidimicrobium sp. AP8]CAB4242604.1 membrane protein of unknown function [Methylacidimicrobium sp. AP8]
MERIPDLLFLATAALIELARRAPAAFLGVLGSAFLGGALSWALLAHSTLLWNKQFLKKARRHPLCVLAGLATFLVLLPASGLSTARPFLKSSIRTWARRVLAEARWKELAFAQAREAMRRNGLPPPPPEAGCLPLLTSPAREAAAAAYSAAALASFARARRATACLLRHCAAPAALALSSDMRSFFTRSPGLYPEERLEEVLAECWAAEADRSSRKVARRMGFLAFLLLLSLHLAAFGIVGYAGYHEIGARGGRKSG